MPLATRHLNDPVPSLTPAPQLEVRREEDAAAMAALQGKTEGEMARRFAAGDRTYVAYWEGEPAAWGWVATRSAEIGELGSSFTISASERYLWNFVTAREHRGRGIYPRLLDAVVHAEAGDAERFWIAYAPENHASGSGIRKAGFTTVAELSFDTEGRPAVRGEVQGGGAAAAGVLGLPVVDAPLAPCWRCVRRGESGATRCTEGQCACDYQRPDVGCAH